MFFRQTMVYVLVCTGVFWGCDAKKTLMTKITEQQFHYFHPRGYETESAFEKLTDRIYTFRYTWYRNIIVDTPTGLVIIDSYGQAANKILKKELAIRFPGKNVKALLYSHYHIDHVIGGKILNPGEVISHKKSPQYWNQLGRKSNLILKPTRLISDDTTLNFKGFKIQAFYLENSHSDTLYAFYFPSEKLLFTADLGLVRTIPPLGVPDRFGPGYLKAMRRLSSLDFVIFVPSHFGYGTKENFLESIDFFEDMQAWAEQVYSEHGLTPASEKEMGDIFLSIYEPMKKKYGGWHGFDQMVLPVIFRFYSGAAMGF